MPYRLRSSKNGVQPECRRLPAGEVENAERAPALSQEQEDGIEAALDSYVTFLPQSAPARSSARTSVVDVRSLMATYLDAGRGQLALALAFS